MICRLLACVVAVVLPASAVAAGPANDPARVGWHFYDDPPPPAPAPVQPPPRAATPTAAPSMPAKAPELKLFEEMQRNMEELRNIAIVRPTEENVRKYMAYERLVASKASRFADVAQQVALNNPELDSTLQGRPISRVAADVYDEQNAGLTKQRLIQLGKDHALFFFFRSDCPYCHAFAPTLARLQAQYGIRVEAVSLDGGALPEFPNPRQNNGIAERLSVRQVPALFIAQPSSGEIRPVSYGVLASAELERRVLAAANPLPVDATSGSALTALRP